MKGNIATFNVSAWKQNGSIFVKQNTQKHNTRPINMHRNEITCFRERLGRIAFTKLNQDKTKFDVKKQRSKDKLSETEHKVWGRVV